jgi:hypothetical protein
MKFAIAAIALAAGLMSADSAMAQPGFWNPGAFWRGAPENPYERMHFLRARVDNGVANGSIDRREAARVDHELDGVDNWIHRMHWEDAGRLSPDQRARVQEKLDGISRQIRWMRRDGF